MSTAKKVALTFDDGPNPPYTDQILDILNEAGIEATFFVCGANVRRYPEVVKKIAKENHLVGNHTFYHHWIRTKLGIVFKETIETQKLINSLTGQEEKLFRAPWKIIPIWLKIRLEKSGFRIIPVDVLGNDWQNRVTADQIINKVIAKTKDKSIIVLHDGYNTKGADRSKTVKALPKIIDQLREKGFQFVKPQELI